jgi:hypothetical protein
MLRAHRSTHEDGDVSEALSHLPGQDLSTEEFADALSHRAVEDVAKSTAFAAVLGEKEDAAEKGRFPKTRVGQNQAAL